MIPRRLRSWVNWYLQERRQDRVAEGDEPPVEPPPDPDPAAAAPTAATEVATRFVNTNNRYSTTTVIPAGDWTLGMHGRTDAFGCMYNSGPSTSPYTSSNTLAIFCQLDGIAVVGKDSAGVTLGVSATCQGNTGSRGIASRFTVIPGKAFFVVVRKQGALVSLWLKYPGHAAVKVGEETTTFGACSSQGAYFGFDRSSSFRWQGAIRRPFFMSYALTEAQINEVAEGAAPTAYGTPSATDWYFPTQTAGTTWTGAINSINAAAFLAGYSTQTGVGHAPLTNGVYIQPDQAGRVYQRASNGRATITLSGWYKGADAPIQILALDWLTGVSVGNWQTIAASPTGGFWSGTIDLPSRNGWYTFQTRKVIGGTPSADVMTSDSRIGVGEVVMLLGQSLVEALASTTASASDIAPNGMWSESLNALPLVNSIGREYLDVTGTSNVGGLVQISTSPVGHGRRTGQRARGVSIGGTTVANAEWTITVTSPTAFTLDGSTFSNAWTSGGFVYFVQPRIRVPNTAVAAVPGGHAVIGNHLSTALGMPVMLINRSVGAQAIESFSSYTYAAGVGGRGTLSVLHAKHAQKVGAVLWFHGQANIGASTYSSDSGSVSAGNATGWGLLGTLYDFLSAQFSNNDFRFGVAAFSQTGGVISALSANTVHDYRVGMAEWCTRKNAAGDARVYFLGYYNDLQPMWENVVTLNSHMSPPSYKRYAARMAQATARKLGASGNDATGPRLVSASRSGATIDLTVQQNGGAGLRVGRSGARPSGFAVSADNFATLLPISDIAIINATTVRITLASDPGAAVRVRYHFGYVGNYTAGVYFTPRVTGAANNGSGAIRLTTLISGGGLTPSNSQPPGGHGLVDGQWITVQEVNGTVEANAIWEVDVIDSENFDLVGSTFTNTFAAGGLYGGSTTGTVLRELGVPVYDDRTIGGHDAAGAPLAPTHTPLLTN